MPTPEERRLSRRKTLDRLMYIDLPSNNGGIVTDLSEGGLGFHAMSPMEKGAGPIRFTFSGGSNRVAGIGFLAWTDERGKTGGLRVTELPDEIREQIRKWPLESKLRLDMSKGAEQDLAPVDQLGPESANASGSPLTSYAPYFPQLLPAETPMGKRNSRVLRAIGVSSLAGVIGVVGYFCFREARWWWVQSKNSGSGEETSQAFTPTSAPPRSSEIGRMQNAVDTSGASDATAQGLPQSTATAAAEQSQTPVFHGAPAAEPEIFFVQVAAYTNEIDAFQLVANLRDQHFVSFVSPPVNDAYYRVQLGPYVTPEAARDTQHQLEKAGFKPFIRH